MRLYTIQVAEAWAQWQRTGVLRADADQVDPDFSPAYQWMMMQMGQRIGPAPRGTASPVWAWYQWSSITKPKPDLRYKGYLSPGSSAVCFSLDVSATDMLLSDFELWHYILNNWYLGSSLVDQEAFEAKCKTHWARGKDAHNHPDPECEDQKQASWARIFDLDWHAQDIADPRPTKKIQATLWELPLENVRGVRPFVAR